jgi:drug/metabolite transporter (DMT)-like permease
MSFTAYAWIATFIYGFETIIVKLTSKYAIKNPWLFNILWNVVFAVAMIPIYATQQIDMPLKWHNLIIASILSAVCCVLYMIATYRLDVSVISPLYNVRTGLSVLFAAMLLGETMNIYQSILVAVIICMGFLVTIDETTTLKSFFRRDILIAMAFMVLLALYTVYLKKTILDLGYWNATVWVAVLSLVFLIPTYPKFIHDAKKLTKKQLVPVVIVTITSVVAYLVSNKAYEVNVGITSVIMTFPSSMIIAFILAVVWPKLMERHTMKVYVMRFIATAIMFVCAVQLTLMSTPSSSAAPVTTKKEMIMVTQTITYPEVQKKKITIQSGRTALDMLAGNATITTKKSSYGILIESINGHVNGTNNAFWTYSINGKDAPIGAAEYIVQDGDIIEWKFTSYE